MTNQDVYDAFAGHDHIKALMYFIKRADAAENGHESAIDVYAQLHATIKVLREAQDAIKEAAIEEAYDVDEDTTFYGYHPEVKERRSFSYKNDAEWAQITARRKAREVLLKQAAEGSRPIVDPLTGEMIEPATITHTTFITLNASK